MAVYFALWCFIKTTCLDAGRVSSSPLDGAADTLVSAWSGGLNRGVTDLAETSILPLITLVVGEKAVLESQTRGPTVWTLVDVGNAVAGKTRRGWRASCSVRVSMATLFTRWTVMSREDMSWPLDSWQAIKAPPRANIQLKAPHNSS